MYMCVMPSQESEWSCMCVIPSQESEWSCMCVIPSQESEWSCICVLYHARKVSSHVYVLGVMYMCVSGHVYVC